MDRAGRNDHSVPDVASENEGPVIVGGAMDDTGTDKPSDLGILHVDCSHGSPPEQ
eukprot:jgi/Botrbrau1/20596/Bobra.113_1s0022.1